ncbi:MAG: cold shock domain-containing protein [Bacteroidetes bacterium]|nr:MAG: cold shock domain-containing protein [Bacteroidota bacterium]
MGRSQESFNKKDVRNKKEKKRKEKEAKKLARRDGEKASFDDMIAYVDENGVITSEPVDPGSKTEIKLEDIAVSVPKGSAEEVDPVRKGTVSFYNESKGFGFIKDMETKQDVFVHANNVTGEIREGNLVTFEVEKGQRGPTAVRVQISK